MDGEHDGVIKLSAHDADELGVETETVMVRPFGCVLHVAGVLESAPTDEASVTSKSTGIIRFTNSLAMGKNVSTGAVLATISKRNVEGGDANEIAYIEMEAAKKELERITPLYKDGIVSKREYNATEAEYKRLAAAYSGMREGSKLIAPTGGTITDILVQDGDYVETGERIATVSKGERMTIRADVPAREIKSIDELTKGKLKSNNSQEVYDLEELGVKRLTDRPVKMIGGYVPVYFEVDRKDINAVPGMIVDLYLSGDECEEVITVPKGSISEQQGVHFVFQRLDSDCYKKIPVTLGRTDGQRVEIKNGLSAGIDVVSKGMIYVKLAESSGAVPEGHSHSH
ncbi:MAG: efflux RND transporter periplasmic adaptor subunit [Clostridiales bacterium]|nr:efflux RND transporter periplasmic adaptor subunit [Clostridiales bacterium]